MAFLTKPYILALLRNRLRLTDVILSMSSFPGGLTFSVGMMSIFDTTHLKDLGSKTEYVTLTSLKMSTNLLVSSSEPKAHW